jgi:hypothetical protein
MKATDTRQRINALAALLHFRAKSLGLARCNCNSVVFSQTNIIKAIYKPMGNAAPVRLAACPGKHYKGYLLNNS